MSRVGIKNFTTCMSSFLNCQNDKQLTIETLFRSSLFGLETSDFYDQQVQDILGELNFATQANCFLLQSAKLHLRDPSS